MPRRYHVPIATAPPRFLPVGKYATVEFRGDCAGSCEACVKQSCVYGIFKENYLHMSSMDEPEYLYTCQSCFRCVQECTKGIFSRVINPEYRTLGDEYWRADIILRNWYQAHTGKIPVSGAGYRGPFVGAGFDSMWTDMSEIVRPTRDGIHGREYINTTVELSRRLTLLRFNKDMSLASKVPAILEIPLPILFRLPESFIVNQQIFESAAQAAQVLGTLMLVDPKTLTEASSSYQESLIPCLTKDNWRDYADHVLKSRMVEIADTSGVQETFAELRRLKPELIISVGIPLDANATIRALKLAHSEADTLHFYANDRGNEIGSKNPRFLKELIREIHLKLVENSARQKINLVFGGGIAMAEHMAKAIICGADCVTVDYILLLALECRLCYRCRENLDCPVKLDEQFDQQWGSQRIINLIGAWRNQLLEVMGAMGLREVRRMRGEVGRSMSFEDLELEIFGPLFGQRKVKELR